MPGGLGAHKWADRRLLEAAEAEGSVPLVVDDDGCVLEASRANVFIVEDGRIYTPPADGRILPGVTRRTLLDLLSREKIPLVERAFRVEEAQGAREAFITSASGTVMPVVAINGVVIGNGYPGNLTRLLRSSFHQVAELSP